MTKGEVRLNMISRQEFLDSKYKTVIRSSKFHTQSGEPVFICSNNFSDNISIHCFDAVGSFVFMTTKSFIEFLTEKEFNESCSNEVKFIAAANCYLSQMPIKLATGEINEATA